MRRRVSDEVGIDAGARNVGRFFLFSIPLALGLAATVWFSLWMMGYNFQKQKEAEKREMSQQERSAVYVGASVRPKGKLAVEIIRQSCLVIVRADLDTKKKGHPYPDSSYEYSLVMYAQNNCGKSVNYAKWVWQTVSPNGTLLRSGYENGCPIPSLGETAECSTKIDVDERVDKFRVWGQIEP